MQTFKISAPVNPYMVNQPFGVNGEYYQRNGINIKGHNGIDLFAYHGQPIYATHDGFAFYQTDNDEGNGVTIVSGQLYDYKGQEAAYKTVYWHMCDPKKEPKYASPVYLALKKKANTGKSVPVKKGDLIGFADSTGLSTGDHLHFALKPMKPGKAYKSGDAPDLNIGSWVNIEQNNGYLGAIDPTPYLDGTFVYTTDTTKSATTPATFTKDLYLGVSDPQVRLLQEWLNTHGYSVARCGAGSTGQETQYYGALTQAAVRKYQIAHGIHPTAGYFGPLTRSAVNNSI